MFDGCNLFTNGAFTLGFSFSRFFLKSFVPLIYSRHKITSSLLTLFKCGCCLGDEWNIKYFAHFITISIWQFYLKELLRFWALGRISRSPRLQVKSKFHVLFFKTSSFDGSSLGSGHVKRVSKCIHRPFSRFQSS